MALRDHLIEALCKFMCESYSWYVTTLTGLVNIDIVKVEMVLINHVTSRDHMFKGLRLLYGW